MNITITPEILLKLKAQEFNHDEMFSLFFVLKAMNDNEIELLDYFDDWNTSKRAVILYQTLFRKGLLENNKEGSPILFKLTPKGQELLNSLEPVKPLKKIDCSDWIEEWNNIFPSIKNRNGVIRSDIKDVTERMNEFLKKYKYTKEVIIAATKAYISHQSANNYEMTQKSKYFIKKQGYGSTLADTCADVVKNTLKDGKLDDGSRIRLNKIVN